MQLEALQVCSWPRLATYDTGKLFEVEKKYVFIANFQDSRNPSIVLSSRPSSIKRQRSHATTATRSVMTSSRRQEGRRHHDDVIDERVAVVA